MSTFEKYHDILMESVAETSEEFRIVILRETSSPLQKFPQHLPPMYRMQALFRYAWDPRSIFAAYPTFWTTSADISQARTNVPATVFSQKTNEIFEANYDFAKAKSAYVWKSIVDPFLGKYSLIKVCSGVIKSDDTLLNVEKGTEERLNKLYVLQGSKPIEVPELHAGDIGAIAKLVSVQTGDSLATKGRIPGSFDPKAISFPHLIPIRDLRL